MPQLVVNLSHMDMALQDQLPCPRAKEVQEVQRAQEGRLRVHEVQDHGRV